MDDKTSSIIKDFNLTKTDDNFLVIDKFANGLVEKSLKTPFLFKITEIRIIISRSVQNWILVNEIGFN